jgi:LysM repeat protein
MRRAAIACALLVASCATAQRPSATAPAANSSPASLIAAGRQAEAPTARGPNESLYADPGDPGSADPDDEVELEDVPGAAPAGAPRPHPLDGVPHAELERRIREDFGSLGSITIGRPSAGALLNAVQMPRGDRWLLVDPSHAWGTQETIDYLSAAIGAVHSEFPDSHPVYIGHISAKRGGALSPHISHQSGRDVDLSFFYNHESSARWYARAHASNLDRARTWALVRALVTYTDVELVLIDRSIQKLLEQHALEIGEDAAWVESLFHGKRGAARPLIVHAKGHATHLHVRFYNPIAAETARRSYDLLLARGLLKPPTEFVRHRVKSGETLGMLAIKYRTSVPAIRAANGLRSNLIVAGREYRIPKRTGIAAPARVAVPERRLPAQGGGGAAKQRAARSTASSDVDR